MAQMSQRPSPTDLPIRPKDAIIVAIIIPEIAFSDMENDNEPKRS